jgi:molecular chaperone GrpE
MAGPTFEPGGGSGSNGSNGSTGSGDQPGPVIRDRRRLDPETGQVRGRHEAGGPDADAGPAADAAGAMDEPDESGESLIHPVGPDGRTEPLEDDLVTGDPLGTGGTEAVSLDGILADLDAAQASAAERLSDLQRLQAEFVNYRRRVDRDRDRSRDEAVAGVLEALLPVLDDVHLARTHGDLEGGPFAAIAEKLETVLERFGLSRYGETGEAFDPSVHEALMHTEADLPEGATTTTVVQVLQPGYRSGERVLRAARVAVADPQ